LRSIALRSIALRFVAVGLLRAQRPALLAERQMHVVGLNLPGENLPPLLMSLIDGLSDRGDHPVNGLVGMGQVL